MFFLKSKETKEIEKIINEAKKTIISNIPHNQLLSIYIGGRILTKDKAPSSDIDLYTVVSENYDLLNDTKINDKLKHLNSNRKCEIK